MANIVLIENDRRVQQQIQQLIREVDEESALITYDSWENFDKAFCPAYAFMQPLEDNPLLQELSDEEKNYLLQNDLIKDSFKQPIEFHFQPGFEIVHQMVSPTPDEMLGFEAKHILNERLAFNNLVPPVFRERWQAATQALQPGTDVRFRLGLIHANRRIHFFDMSLHLNTQGLPVLVGTDVTGKITESIRLEKKRRDDMANDKDRAPFNVIHLILFRTTCVQRPILRWVERIFSNCRTLNYFPQDTQTRFVALKYEDDGVSHLDFIHPKVDDLLHLPLDRLLFLQKIDILLNLPKRVSPRFLFQQQTETPIEISKRTPVTKLADVGLVISNPIPLKEGTLGNFYLTLPNQKETLHLYGKVMKNDLREDGKGYDVAFGFIGQTRTQTLQLRKFLTQQKGYSPFVNGDETAFGFNPDSLFISEEDRKPRNIILLDTNDIELDHAAQMIHDELDHIHVVTESSYIRLLQTHLGSVSNEITERLSSAQPVTPLDLPSGNFNLFLSKDKKMVQKIDPQPTPESQLLGHRAADWIGKETFIKTLFPEKDLAESFEESLSIVAKEKPVVRLFLAKTAAATFRAVTIELTWADEHTVRLNFSAPSKELFQKRLLAQKSLTSLDALVIDSAFIPQTVDSFVGALETAARNKGLLSGEHLNIIVLVDEAHVADLNIKRFEHPCFRAVLIKPVDGRSLGFAISFWAKAPFSRYCFSNITWRPVQLTAYMATDIILEEVSEFGATLRHPRPITPGAVLFLRKSIFDKAPGESIPARFYRCEEHSGKKGFYACSVLYFGINDAFMKYARSYFRETYAQSKEKESG